MEPLLMPPVSQRCPSLYIESMLPSFSHHMPLFSCSKEVETCVGHSSVILTLHVGHSRYSYWFVHFMIESFHIIQPCWVLVLDDEGCINSLLPVDFIPSTLDHLFWDRNLESFLSALRLAVISGRFSHHRKFWEYINVPWSMDSLKCSTSTHFFTLVSFHSSTLIPIFIIGGWSRVC